MSKMRQVALSLILSTALAALAFGQPAHQGHAPASTPPPPLTLRVESVQGAAGQEIDVPIMVKGASGIGPMEMVLSYDPAVLEAKEQNCAKKGPLLANCLIESRSDKSGKMAILWATNQAINGDGTLVVAHFTVRGQAGQKTPLTLQKVRAWSWGHPHLDALVTTEAGEFTVAGAGWPSWVIAVAVVVALVVLLLILAAFRRRQSLAA